MILFPSPFSPPMIPNALTWADVFAGIRSAPAGRLWGVPRGGAIVAGLTGRAVDRIEDADAIVDDILDSGATRDRYRTTGKPFWALVDRERGNVPTGWIEFPWEGQDATADPAENVRRLLQCIGEDPKRDGLLDTPKRVVKVFRPLIACGAAAVILSHNHPSGDPMPSRQDVELTARLRQVGDLCGIIVLDHVVVAVEGYASLSERGWT